MVSYPEMPFRDTVPFVKHADVGLQTIAYRPGVEVLTDGLKVIQFSYVGVPVVMPTFIKSSRPNVVTYQPGDDRSAARAIETALAMDVARQTDVPSWRSSQRRSPLIQGTPNVVRCVRNRSRKRSREKSRARPASASRSQ